ncbi:MAG: 4Fe-4S cluster-binding domain-containing protein [Lachnospiraceae bacterium]|nr:4Fe-4S cluster-binding domain-containing protein [Lachnospiraceae bacterium]
MRSAAGRAAHEKNAARLGGSGAVFFSGCPLGCVYCQNRAISRGQAGKEISAERLAEIFLELKEQGALNINLVTAGHYVPQVCTALRLAKDQGLSLPVVWNSSGYETVGTLRMLEGLVDIYLPDLKYLDPALAKLYSHAEDYPEVAKAAIREMVRQQPQPRFAKDDIEAAEASEDGKTANRTKIAKDTNIIDDAKGMDDAEDGECLMKAGVIVRHLLLPGHVREAKHVVSYLHEIYGDQIYISLMNQYTPPADIFSKPYPKAGSTDNKADCAAHTEKENAAHLNSDNALEVLRRTVTKREYERLLDYAIQIGVTQGFFQEGGTAAESFIPAFDGTGVTKPGS